jgi:hypothetical protein
VNSVVRPLGRTSNGDEPGYDAYGYDDGYDDDFGVGGGCGGCVNPALGIGFGGKGFGCDGGYGNYGGDYGSYDDYAY